MLNTRYLHLALGLSLLFAPLSWGQDKPEGEKREGDKPAEQRGEERPKDKSPEQVFKDLDKNADGELTGDEIADDKKRFFEHLLRVGDKDKDGKLTGAEFAEGFKPDELKPAGNPRGQPGDQPRLENPDGLFDRIDANKDGKLQKSEIPERGRELIGRVFEGAGKDELTKEEFRRGFMAAMVRDPRARAGQPEGNPDDIFERSDANKDGKLSKSEIPERGRELFAKIFEGAATDELTKEEFRKGFMAAMARGRDARPGQPEGGPDAMFDRLDTNKDGKLSKSEIPERGGDAVRKMLEGVGKDELTRDEFRKMFMAAMARGAGGGQPGGYGDQLFETLDTNKDGKFSKSEIPERGRDIIERIFKVADRDDLTKDEFRRAQMTVNSDFMFDRLDANKDGQIARSEIPEAQKEMILRVFDKAGTETLNKDEFRKMVAAIRSVSDTEPKNPDPNDIRRPDVNRPDPNRPDPNRPDPNKRDPNQRDPNRPDPNRPDLNRPDPNKRDPNGRDPNRPDPNRPGGPRPIPGLFGRLDANHDGRVSKEELVKAAEMFDELDLNKDGHLDPHELLGDPPRPREPGPDGRRPEGVREGELRGEPRDGERRVGEPRDDGRREGDRKEGDRKDGERREGDRKEEPRREGDPREGDRREEGNRKEGERTPERSP